MDLFFVGGGVLWNGNTKIEKTFKNDDFQCFIILGQPYNLT